MRLERGPGLTVALILAATLYSPDPYRSKVIDLSAGTDAVGAAARAEAEEPPAGLTRDDWSRIRRSIPQSEYHARRVAKPGETPALQAPNRRQAYHTTFRRQGIEIVSHAPAGASWRLGLSVTGYGYEGDVRPLEPAEPQAEKETVKYHRGRVAEWYVNRPGGLEQGFELEEPAPRRGRPLVIAMAVEGDLDVSVDGDGASFAHRSGETLVRYSGLEAWDAERRPLRSHLERADREIRLVVEAQEARFPVTVDPTFVHEAQFLGPGGPFGQPNARFGTSVSVSGDTVVVGAPLEDTPGGVDAGSAYVFVRSGTTWIPQQRLLASDAAAGELFGYSVSISGNTVVVGAPVSFVTGGMGLGVRVRALGDDLDPAAEAPGVGRSGERPLRRLGVGLGGHGGGRGQCWRHPGRFRCGLGVRVRALGDDLEPSSRSSGRRTDW